MGGNGSVCAFPGSLDPYFCDQNVPEPFLLNKTGRQGNWQMRLPLWNAGFPRVVTKLSRVFPAEGWKRPPVVIYGHCQLLCWPWAFYWALQVPTGFLASETLLELQERENSASTGVPFNNVHHFWACRDRNAHFQNLNLDTFKILKSNLWCFQLLKQAPILFCFASFVCVVGACSPGYSRLPAPAYIPLYETHF